MIISDTQTDEVTLLVEFESEENVDITQLIDEGTEKLYYEIRTTRDGEKTATKVRSMDGDLLATYQTQGSQPAQVSFENGKTIAVKAWLRKGIMPFSE